MAEANENRAALERSPVPLYVQLTGILRRKIDIAEWKAGQQVPTLVELMAEFGVSRVTARQAIGALESEGLIWRRQGKGTFVADRLPEKNKIEIDCFWRDLVARAEREDTRLLRNETASHCPILEPADGEAASAYQHLQRVHSAGEGTPFRLTDIWIDEAVFSLAPATFERMTVLPQLDRMIGDDIARARQRLTAGAADVEAARLLDVPIGTPLALIRRWLVDRAGTVVYLSRSTYPGDRISLELDLRPNG